MHPNKLIWEQAFAGEENGAEQEIPCAKNGANYYT